MEGEKQNMEPAEGRRIGITAILLLTGFLAITALSFLLGHMQGRIRKTVPGAGLDASDILWDVERLYYDVDHREYTIDGWAFIPGEEIDSYQCHVLLYDRETGDYLQLPTAQVDREDLLKRFPEYAENPGGMAKSGFTCLFDRDLLEGEFSRYEICIRYQHGQHDSLILTRRPLDQF